MNQPKEPTESQWIWISAFAQKLKGLTPEQQQVEMHNQPPEVAALMPYVAKYRDLTLDLDRDRSGERIGDFILEKRIGAGGMGVVYLAKETSQLHTGRTVAVKLIRWPPTLSPQETEERISRFKSEVEKLSKHNSAHVVNLFKADIHKYDSGEIVPYLAMQYIPRGRSLRDYVREVELEPTEVLRLMTKVCQGIQHIHDLDIIHCDLKPENILVDSTGEPRVTDFGLAKKVWDNFPRAQDGMGEGTPAYMSPEQITDEFGAITKRSDVYTLGVILHELLAGKLPYEIPVEDSVEQREVEVRRRILEEEPTYSDSIRQLYNGQLKQILDKALAKSPENRFTSVQALKVAIERTLRGTEDAVGKVTKPKIPSNIPHLSPHFTERLALMELIRCSFTTEGRDLRTRLTALRNYGGNGKTVAAILYAHRSVASYPGGRFFLNLSEGGFAESLKQLAPLLGIKTEEPTKTKDGSVVAKLVKTRLENGDRSLLVLDNVDTLINWQEIVASGLLPHNGCDLLITTRLDSIPHAAIVPVTRLDKVETYDVLSRFCRGAAAKNKGGRTGPSESEAASIHSLLGGLALAIAAVGAFMKRNTHVSWKKYCQNLRDLPVDQLPDASERVRAELGLEFGSLPEHKRSLRVIDDALDALAPREIRAIEYAALMAEDRVLRSWLENLIESDSSVDGGPVADSSDPTPEDARIVEGLIDSDLLVALGNTSVGPQLSLHRLFRLRAVERAETKGTLWDLVQRLAKFLDKKADSTYLDGYVSSMDLAALDNYPSSINRMVGLGMIDFAKQLAAKVFNQANAFKRPDELRQVFYKLIELIDMTPADSLTLADAAMLMRAARDWHSHRDSQKAREWAKQAYDISLTRGAQFPIQQAEFAYDYANILYKQDCPETAWQVLTDNLPKIWDEEHGPQANLLREFVALALSVRPRTTPVDDSLIRSRAAQLEFQEYKDDVDIKDFFSLASSVFFHAHQLVWAKAALSVQMAKFKYLIGVADVEYAKFLYQMAYIEKERGRHDSAQSQIKEAENIGLAAAKRLHEEDLSSGEPFPLFLENQTFRLDEAKIDSVDQYLCKWFEYPNYLGTGRWFEWSSKLSRRHYLN